MMKSVECNIPMCSSFCFRVISVANMHSLTFSHNCTNRSIQTKSINNKLWLQQKCSVSISSLFGRDHFEHFLYLVHFITFKWVHFFKTFQPIQRTPAALHLQCFRMLSSIFPQFPMSTIYFIIFKLLLFFFNKKRKENWKNYP